MTLQTRCLDARSDQDAIRRAWSELAPGADRGYLGHSADWFFGHLDWISPAPRRLRFVLVQDGARPLALVPLEARTVTLKGIRLRCAGLIDSPYAGPNTALLIAGNHEGVGDAFAQFVFGGEPGWRCFSMNGLLLGSASEACLMGAFAQRGIGFDRRADAVPYVRFRSGWSGYMESRSHNFRRSLSRSIRRLDAMGEVDYQSLPGDGVGALAVVDALDGESWRTATPRDVEQNAALGSYCRRLFETFPNPAHHFVRCLRVDGKPVASFYALVYGGVAYAIKINYAMAYSEGSPGFCLMLRSFEELAAMGIEKIELMGTNQYLRRLGNESRAMSKVLVFNRSGLGRVLATVANAAAMSRRSAPGPRVSGRD